ncbi:MAG: chemotaxis protein CheC [Candidatus Hydrothermarchaeales archaeon]
MQLTEFQRDAIREVVQIGTGNALTAMAKVVKREIDIEIPTIELCSIEEVPKKIGSLDMLTLGIYIEVKGDLRGRLLTIFSKKDALKLASMLSGKKVEKLGDVSIKAVASLGDILAVSNLGAISDFFEMKIHTSPSEIAYDMLGALLQQVLVDIGQYSDTVLFSKTHIFVSSERFNCLQIFFLESTSLESLLRALEVKV